MKFLAIKSNFQHLFTKIICLINQLFLVEIKKFKRIWIQGVKLYQRCHFQAKNRIFILIPFLKILSCFLTKWKNSNGFEFRTFHSTCVVIFSQKHDQKFLAPAGPINYLPTGDFGYPITPKGGSPPLQGLFVIIQGVIVYNCDMVRFGSAF